MPPPPRSSLANTCDGSLNFPSFMKPHRGTLILVFGIVSLVVCAPLGIVAWIMGNNDLREMDSGTMDPAGRGNTSAGRICGIIGTVLLVLQVLIAIGFVAFGAFFMVRSPAPQVAEPTTRPSYVTPGPVEIPQRESGKQDSEPTETKK